MEGVVILLYKAYRLERAQNWQMLTFFTGNKEQLFVIRR